MAHYVCSCQTVYKLKKESKDLFDTPTFIKWSGEDKGKEFKKCYKCDKNLKKQYRKRKEI